ncbi:White-opaque regulator 1-like protein 1 [Phlyctema vagabunda]|uniref:White-opaque regulator 1-like protein 1 n=1 Tax=Phlyctema vagabunda TaxID=108571 RepID=A0ABR4PM40_9HELO
MVNIGRPSRGCTVCRKRKIKCDEASPGCSYCFKKQIVCPGYQDAFDLAFRDQSIVAERSVQRRKKATDRQGHGRISCQGSSNLSLVPDLPAVNIQMASSTSLSTSSRVQPSLSEDYSKYALDFFCSSYLTLPRPPEVRQGCFELLYPVFKASDPSSPLRPATYAVGSVLLEAWILRSPGNISTARPFYLKALSKLRAILSDANATITDDILMAVLILEVYEGLVSFFKGDRSKGTHVSGAVALVHNRKSDLSQDLVVAVRNNMVDTAIQSSQPVPPVVTPWKDVAVNSPKNAAERVDEIDFKVANILALAATELPKIDATSKAGSEALQRLLDAAEDIDTELAAWASSVPESWAPIVVSGPQAIPASVKTAGLYGDSCAIYSHILIANTLNRYRCFRSRLNSLIITCHIKFQTQCSPTKTAKSLEIIQQMVDGICSSVPFYLGDRTARGRLDVTIHYPQIPHQPLPEKHLLAAPTLGGWFLIARLKDALSLNCSLRQGQHEWIRGQMGRLIRIYGIEPSTKP